MVLTNWDDVIANPNPCNATPGPGGGEAWGAPSTDKRGLITPILHRAKRQELPGEDLGNQEVLLLLFSHVQLGVSCANLEPPDKVGPAILGASIPTSSVRPMRGFAQRQLNYQPDLPGPHASFAGEFAGHAASWKTLSWEDKCRKCHFSRVRGCMAKLLIIIRINLTAILADTDETRSRLRWPASTAPGWCLNRKRRRGRSRPCCGEMGSGKWNQAMMPLG